MKKNILLIATGSVAVIKTKKLFDLLKTKFNVKLITSDYVKKHYKEYNELEVEEPILDLNSYPHHILLAKWADLIVVVPASANTISKYRYGISDNFILTVLAASRTPIIFIPAMNTYMYYNLLSRNIIDDLQFKFSSLFIGPIYGKLREAEVGMGRMSEPETIYKIICDYVFVNKNKKILIAYGASKIYLDPIRYISNDSTGTFGKLIANELRLKGFDVTEININNQSNEEFITKILKLKNQYDLFICAAAFADFKTKKANFKIKKSENLILKLDKNIDVLTKVNENNIFKEIIGFKLDDNFENAINKKTKLSLDGILWNKIGAMNNNKITGAFLYKKNSYNFKNKSKNEIAKLIARKVLS